MHKAFFNVHVCGGILDYNAATLVCRLDSCVCSLLSLLSAARSGLEGFLWMCVHRLDVSVDVASM